MKKYFKFIQEIIEKIDREPIGKILNALEKLQKEEGRLFIIGIGGSAANASHAVSDFRKLCGIEAYCPTDNIAELTAHINDNGWENCFRDWLSIYDPTEKDMLLVFSVGGGSEKVSANIVKVVKYAKALEMFVGGIVGRDGGYTKKIANWCVIVPTVTPYLITPFVESFQAIIWHFWVFHSSLQINQGKWEDIAQKLFTNH